MNPSTSVIRRLRRAWPPTARTAAAVIAMAVVALLAGACSGGGPSSATGSGGSSNAAGSSSSTSAVAYSRCMRSHGVPKFPDPKPGGALSLGSKAGVDPNTPQFKAAQQTCQKLVPGSPIVSAPPSGSVLHP